MRRVAGRGRRGAPVSRVTAGLAGVLLAVLLTGACAAGGSRTDHRSRGGGCDTEVEEPLDPRSTQHLLPGAPEPTYASDAPTSGPHRVGSPPEGAQADPLPPPDQVALLEQGYVLLQHRRLSGPERRQIETLAGDKVVVAPLRGPGPAVVATAWRHRLTCRGVELAPLRAFVAAHRGKAGG